MVVAQKENLKTGKVRFQLDLLEQQADIFDQLKEECGLETRKELFNVAMTLFHWAVKETKSGRKISSYDPVTDDVETIVMPALNFLSSQLESAEGSKSQSNSAANHQRGFSVVRKSPVPS